MEFQKPVNVSGAPLAHHSYVPKETAGRTEVHNAARDYIDYKKFVRLLDEYPKAIFDRDFRGNTLLHSAAYFGQLNNLAVLLKKGAAPLAVRSDGNSAYDMAEIEDYQAVCSILPESMSGQLETDLNECVSDFWFDDFLGAVDVVAHILSYLSRRDILKLALINRACVNATKDTRDAFRARQAKALEAVDLSSDAATDSTVPDKTPEMLEDDSLSRCVIL